MFQIFIIILTLFVSCSDKSPSPTKAPVPVQKRVQKQTVKPDSSPKTNLLLKKEAQSQFKCNKNQSFLFNKKSKLRLSVQADFQKVNRASTKEESLSYAKAWITGNRALKWNLKVSGRGNQRFSNCKFRPLKFNFSKKDKDLRWVHAGEKFKLVTHCNLPSRSLEENTQSVYLEAFLYSIQNTFMRFSYRVRLADITYLSLDGSVYDRGVAFFIEPAKVIAKRCYLKSLKRLGKVSTNEYETYEKHVGLLSAPYNIFQKEFTEVFNLFIYNNDYMIPADAYDSVHNLSQFHFPAQNRKFILAYDLDQSGLIQAGKRLIDGREYMMSVSTDNHIRDLKQKIQTSTYRKAILRQFKSKHTIIKRKIDNYRYLNNDKKEILYDWLEDIYFLVK